MKHCKEATTALLAYATYITWKCPCDKLLGCHMKTFFLTVGLASALVLRENAVRG
jgi:hypothetical protein